MCGMAGAAAAGAMHPTRQFGRGVWHPEVAQPPLRWLKTGRVHIIRPCAAKAEQERDAPAARVSIELGTIAGSPLSLSGPAVGQMSLARLRTRDYTRGVWAGDSRFPAPVVG